MTGLAQRYLGIIQSELQATSAYRLNVIMRLLHTAYPLIALVMWRSSANGEAIDGITPAALSAYFALVLLTNSWQFTFPILFEFGYLVHSGRLSQILLRPGHPAHVLIATAVGRRSIMDPVLLVVAVLALFVTGGALSTSLSTWFIALTTFVLGTVANIYVSLIVAVIAFWSTKSTGVQGLLAAADWLIGGLLAPVVLLPDAVAALAVHLPFWLAIGAGPAMVSGIVAANPLVALEALAWVVVLHLLYRRLWGAGMARFESVGT